MERRSFPLNMTDYKLSSVSLQQGTIVYVVVEVESKYTSRGMEIYPVTGDTVILAVFSQREKANRYAATCSIDRKIVIYEAVLDPVDIFNSKALPNIDYLA